MLSAETDHDSAADQITREIEVAIVDRIDERRPRLKADQLGEEAGSESGDGKRLIEGADGVRDIIQFRVDRNSDFAQSNHHTQHGDGQNQDQFRANDHTRFVMHEFLKHFM